jgi:hypothetical protein
VVKLKNVFVDPQTLLRILIAHCHSLKNLELEKVFLTIADSIDVEQSDHIFLWTHILHYIGIKLSVERITLSSLGWHHQNTDSQIDTFLRIPKIIWKRRCLDPGGQQYSRLLRTLFEARGVEVVKIGLDKMVEELYETLAPKPPAGTSNQSTGPRL